MRDISARELKGHNILAVERFWDDTRWMIEFSVLRPSTAYGSPGEEMRLFLTEDGYQAALQSQQRREINKGDGNPHVHLLVTLRPFNSDHSWGNKEIKDWEFATSLYRYPSGFKRCIFNKNGSLYI